MKDIHIHSDHPLLQKTAEGDTAAFTELFFMLWDSVYSAAFRLTKSHETAEDLAQEIFLKVWKNREQLVDIENFPAYLYTLTRNLCLDFLRRKVFVEENRERLNAWFLEKKEVVPVFLEKKEWKEDVLNAAAQLSPQLRQVFLLSYMEGLSHQEIAEAMNITPASSRVYLARAIAALKKILPRAWWIPLLFRAFP